MHLSLAAQKMEKIIDREVFNYEEVVTSLRTLKEEALKDKESLRLRMKVKSVSGTYIDEMIAAWKSRMQRRGDVCWSKNNNI